MEANELRIGNYFRYGDCFVHPFKGKIDVISYRDFEESEDLNPIPLTEEWLLKFGFENWGLGTQWNNRYESYVRYVRHNDLGGTSNFEIHYIKSTYGNTEYYQYIISCDEDDRLNWGEEIINVHQLQNLYFALTNKELKIVDNNKNKD